MQAIGYLEATLTHDRIRLHYDNMDRLQLQQHSLTAWPAELWAFLEENLSFVQKQCRSLKGAFWSATCAHVARLDGLARGYRQSSSYPLLSLGPAQLWLHQARGELRDYLRLFPWSPPPHNTTHAVASDPNTLDFERANELLRATAVGAIVLPRGEDLWIGHSTWGPYSRLHRVLKEIVRDGSGDNALFSSAPGVLHSPDGFYAVGRSLVVAKSEFPTATAPLYAALNASTAFVPAWLRGLAASFAAKSGRQWVHFFAAHAKSCASSAQWAVLDRRSFRPGASPISGLLWVAEQIPTRLVCRDMTRALAAQRAWLMVGRPADPQLARLAGYAPDTNSTLYRILARDIPQINSFSSFKHLLRRNNYARDPLAHNDPARQPAARFDLRKRASAAFGAIDCKAQDGALARNRTFHAISSPTYEGQPPWDFRTPLGRTAPHAGLPDLWRFPWVSFSARDVTTPLSVLATCLLVTIATLLAIALVLIAFLLVRRVTRGRRTARQRALRAGGEHEMRESVSLTEYRLVG